MGTCWARRSTTCFLAGYAAGVDTPFSACWRDLAAAYPNAPVLLSHRSTAEVWHRSMDMTVLARTRDMLAMDDDADPMVPLFRVMFHDVFTNPDEPAEVMEGYERRLARAEGPAHRHEQQPEAPLSNEGRSSGRALLVSRYLG